MIEELTATLDEAERDVELIFRRAAKAKSKTNGAARRVEELGGPVVDVSEKTKNPA